MNPSDLIDAKMAQYNDWRGEMYAQLRRLINDADPEIKEDWKWSTAVWTKDGLVCALGAFKSHVKINFFHGVSLKDPNKLINSGLDSKDHRAIDLYEGDKIDGPALQELVREAIAVNKK